MKHRPRLTYANVMVTLLAFVVLGGGGAYAAQQLAKNSVGPRQLKKNSVTGAKVKDGSLRAKDLAPGSLPTQGAPGPAGPAGPSGTSRVYQASGSVNYDKFSSSPFGSQVVTLTLPPGNYFAIATVSVQTVNPTASTVTCRLINGNGGSNSTAVSRNQIARSDMESDNMSLAGGFSVSGGQTLNLQCSKLVPASGARITDANVVAVTVTDVSGQPG